MDQSKVIVMKLLAAVARERRAQDDKFGVQQYPLTGTAEQEIVLTGRSYGVWAAMFKAYNDAAIETGTRTGDAVLLEEVYEAFTAAPGRDRLEELVQTAAVALLLAEMEIRRGVAAMPPAPAYRHGWSGADRLHGLCRCGEGEFHTVHEPAGVDLALEWRLKKFLADSGLSYSAWLQDPAAVSMQGSVDYGDC